MAQMDALDLKAAEHFDGYLVRKDLAVQFQGRYPVPTYVGEFLLGRYCATTDEEEIAEGLSIVDRLMKERTVRAGEEELFKAQAREKGRVKVIDIIKAKLDARHDAYKAELPSLQLDNIHIGAELVNAHERMLTGGFYVEATLEYLPALAQQPGGQPFRIDDLRPIQMSSRNALEVFSRHRNEFTLNEWRDLLLRSVGFEPARFTERERDMLILRMVPFVVRNYNAVELGPRGTGKSHLYQQISPYSHLVSGGVATIANMFVNMATGRRGLVAQYDVVCFDEISGVSFERKEGVNILKGYMESGEFSRGRESIRADGGIVMVGNFDVDVDEQLRKSHLLGPLPKEMRDDTAFMDRIHAFIPGWDIPKLDPTHFTPHFGFVSDFLAEVWTQSRVQSRVDVVQGRVEWNGQLSGRDRKAALNTIDGLLKLLFPDPEMPIPDEELRGIVELSLELRRRVKEQQATIGEREFGKVDLGYRLDGGPESIVYCGESVRFRAAQDDSNSGEDGEGALPVPDPEEVETSEGTSAKVYAPGDTFAGRFEIEEVLGAGGFSTVYRVLDVVEQEERALKVFVNAAGYEAVRREIGALRKVRHPNIVEVFWAGKADSGEWWLVSEFVDGDLLEDFTSGSKHLRDSEAISVTLDILDALIAIHPDSERIEELRAKSEEDGLDEVEFEELQRIQESGLVHRDVKPQNVILARSGGKLLDFNIASRVGTEVKTTAGTPPYQPPDPSYTRWDVSTDLFATGVVLYELLTDGSHPYPNREPMVGSEVVDPRTKRPDMSPAVADFLVKSCAPYREDRFQTAAGMRESLVVARDGSRA